MAPLAGALVLVVLLLDPVTGMAQITLDGTIRPGAPSGPLAGPNFVVPAEAGAMTGNNLFHSFGQFNVQAGESATFTGPGSIENVISRVTGGTHSFIDGLIDSRTSMPGANFFLLNPSGVLFGPGAQLNVGGSFHVSTADCLRAAGASCVGPDDGTSLKLFADPARPSVLTADAPAAFGFLSPAPVRIVVEGGSLQVADGKTLSLIGGEAPFPGEAESGLRIEGTSLVAPSGRIQIVSVASPGEVSIGPDLQLTSVASLGRVDLVGGASLDASGDPGGSVVIRAGRLLMDQSSIVVYTLGDADGAPTAVDLLVSGDVAIGGDMKGIDVRTFGTGAAGDVAITAGRLEMENSALIQSITNRGGTGGDIFLDVGTLTLTGGATISSASDVAFLGFGGGPGGDVSVTASDSIVLDGGSGLSTSTSATLPGGTGTGGRLSIITPSLTLDNGASLTSFSSGTAAGGDIVVQTESLNLSHGATINSQTTIDAPGGNVSVTATGALQISETDTGIFSGSSGSGPAGAISLNVGRLALTDGAVIQSGLVLGQGGNVAISASDSVVVSGGSGISIQAFEKAVGQLTVSAPSVLIDDGFLSTSTIGTGSAGPISLTVGTLTLVAGGQISSSSDLVSTGAGGDVTVTATEGISISGSAPSGVPSDPFATDPSSGLFSTAMGSGAAGTIFVSTPTLTLGDGGTISVATEGSGHAGTIAVNATDLTIGSGGRIDSGTTGAGGGGDINLTMDSLGISGTGSGLFSDAEASGPGGDINVTANTITLTDDATISATSTGTAEALAGSINIVFGQTFDMRGDSSITTSSVLADGGNISITATGSLLHLIDSDITTSVQSGVGGGGNITVGSAGHPLDFIVFDGSQIRADAFGGPGGNITIFAGVYLTQNSVISASSQLAAPGTISVQAQITDVSGALASLPEAIVEAAALLRASCATRLAEGKTSSLVVAGRGGVPPAPDGPLWSPLAGFGTLATGSSAAIESSDTLPVGRLIALPLFTFSGAPSRAGCAW